MASQLFYYLVFLKRVLQKLKLPFILASLIFFLLGIAFGYQLKKPTQIQPSYKLLHIKNTDKSISFIRTLDINNDGADEVIYEPRSASWYNNTFILKRGDESNPFIPFCEHCQFETYASSVEFKDLNNDKLFDIRLPEVVDSKDNYKKSSDVIYLFNGEDYIKQ